MTYFLHATARSRRDSHADASKEKVLVSKTNRKQGNNFDSRKGNKERGRKEGRKEDRKQKTTA